MQARGPLDGVKVIEFGAIGPAPFAVMLLADLGASVVRIDRAGGGTGEWPEIPIVSRGRAIISLDLRSEAGMKAARDALAAADVLVEGFRPGVMERLGLGPEDVAAFNPGLVYGRMTGWGQTGPRALTAGHDINYIAITGMLGSLGGRQEPPRAPLNLLGDYGGGGLYLALGIVAALFERGRSGKGQVVDAAIVDGAASMMAPILGMIGAGLMPGQPAHGMLGGDEAYYRTYRCADGKYLAVGPLEPRFRQMLTERLGLAPGSADAGDTVAELLATRPRDEWAAMFEGSDACVAPVLDIEEAPAEPHMAAREVFVTVDGLVQPAPAPRLSRTPGVIGTAEAGEDRLRSWGVELSA